MKIDDLVRFRGLPLIPSPRDGDDLGFVPQAMASLGYDGVGVREVLGVADLPAVVIDEMVAYLRRCRTEASPRALLAELWILGRRVASSALEGLLGAGRVDTLVRRGILRRVQDETEARLDLYPCEGAWVFTDRMLSPTRSPYHVYELGKDSHALARVTPRRPVRRVLDLCTGSGIHAILSARHGEAVVGVDLNPRALDYARVNAAMNGVGDRCRFVRGDLYEAIGEETFDLIVSNPPWVPTPDRTMQMYRTGGETGEAVTRAIVEGLPAHLSTGGTLSLFTLYPIIRGEDYLGRVRAWLPSSGWGVLILQHAETSAEGFARLHMASTPDIAAQVREFDRWMESYEALGIEKIGMASMLVRRLGDEDAGWGVQRSMRLPTAPFGSQVACLLDAIERAHRPDAFEAVPSLERAPGIAHLWVDPETGEGCAEFSDVAWSAPVRLSRIETALARALGPGVGFQSLIDARLEAGSEEAAVRREVREALRSLVAKGVL